MAIDKKQWLEQHIPHRVRGVLVGTGLYPEFGVATTWPSCDPVQRRFITDAGWEARIICIRWLVEFVGIKADKTGKPMPVKRRRPKQAPNDFDVGIEDVGAKSMIYPQYGPHAAAFAKTWLAASKASAHVSAEKPHPMLEDRKRNATAVALVDHLSATVYAGTNDWLKRYVFREAS